MTAVRVNRLSKSFSPGQRALRDITLSIEPGEMVALIGASGSGKSTLIRHIAGLSLADADAEAEVEVLGRTLQRAGRPAGDLAATRRLIGVIFQQFNLVGRLSLLTNVLIGVLGSIPAWRGHLGWFGRGQRERAMDCLCRVGMDEYAGQRASTLSGGQQQRAAIARVLLQQARVILADEPIASLDPQAARRVMEILAEINRVDGVTVLVSLHQVAYAQVYCPRTIALRDGQVAYDGDSRVLTPDFLNALYGAESETLFLPEIDTRETARSRLPSMAPAEGLRQATAG